ncbi:hypothetical protein [Janthinobacterium sp. PSPC3-1]|uniref:hypothetical protein n=1 Tax=Janthinobacterium sp. PSPC3-1 TaxID=2804653 RepID=UPI003CF17ECC
MLDDAARAAYAAAYRPDRETAGGLGSMDEAMRGAQLFEVVVAGAVVVRYALRQDHYENGSEIVIVAAAGGLPGVDLVASLVPTIERQGAIADRMTMRTRRPGLVRKMKKQGWVLDAYCMGKTIK